jgi:hypothetical protein
VRAVPRGLLQHLVSPDRKLFLFIAVGCVIRMMFYFLFHALIFAVCREMAILHPAVLMPQTLKSRGESALPPNLLAVSEKYKSVDTIRLRARRSRGTGNLRERDHRQRDEGEHCRSPVKPELIVH